MEWNAHAHKVGIPVPAFRFRSFPLSVFSCPVDSDVCCMHTYIYFEIRALKKHYTQVLVAQAEK